MSPAEPGPAVPTGLEDAQGWLFEPPPPRAGEGSGDDGGEEAGDGISLVASARASRRLGRGLAALLGEIPQDPSGAGRVIALSSCAEDDDEEDLPDLLPPGAAFGLPGALPGSTSEQAAIDDPDAVFDDPDQLLLDDEVGGLDFPDVDLE